MRRKARKRGLLDIFLLPFYFLKYCVIFSFLLVWEIIKFPFNLIRDLTGGISVGKMSGQEYEKCVANYLRNHGYWGVSVTKVSGDYGVDVIANKHGAKYAVQCKYYSSPVGLSAVQEVVAGKAHYDCNAAMVVTNNIFTDAAKKLAKENNVKLLEKVSGNRTCLPAFRNVLLVMFGLLIIGEICAIVSGDMPVILEDRLAYAIIPICFVILLISVIAPRLIDKRKVLDR